MAQQTPEETTSLLNRLTQKPGVTSTLILSRSTGAVVRASGLVSYASSDSPGTNGASDVAPHVTTQDLTSTTSSIAAEVNGESGGSRGKKLGLKSAEDVARLVWRFFGSAESVTDDMLGTEDEVRLLRLRTKRNEIVVVPDAKFLLVVIHDTPPA